MPIRSGEIWDVEHQRKGTLTIWFLRDVADADEWIEGEIVEGRVCYASAGYRIAQFEDGFGTPGDTLTMRHSFVRFIKRRHDLEQGAGNLPE
jgi:hypothetical protein